MFTDSSTGTSITNRRWDFGDGNVSNYVVATNPSHRYSSAGTYSVNLTVNQLGRIKLKTPVELYISECTAVSTCGISLPEHRFPAQHSSGCDVH